MEWNKDSICELLKRNDRAVERALIVLYNNQTEDEQNAHVTSHANGRGFTGYDAEFYSSLAERVISGQHLSPRMLACLRKPMKNGQPRIGKYWSQLLAAIPTEVQS
jgi:hypothetical protein